jgi:ATP-dependent RNA helicase DeaD
MISPLSEALAERGYDKLTPVQEAVTDPALAESDLLVSAQTGSGKTVGFGLAIARTLMGDEMRMGPAALPLALVVAPTRELAFQVMRELSWLYAKTGARVTSCVGGMDMRDERRALERGAHIVVGTPGRLSDHIRRGSLDLSDARAVVLDEADEMLDLGFREDLEFILADAPQERRTLLFSATVSPPIAKLAEKFQRDAKRINTLGGTSQHADISYQALRVGPTDSEHAIINLLRYHDSESAIVFANTRAAVNHLTARLGNRGLAVVTLSGELSQTERTHALQAMRDGRARVCVATDVAARGIDLPNLNLVIHADLPVNTEGLLHRSGRTGRAGRKGISALIVPPRATKKAERLLQFAKIKAEWTTPPRAEDILRRDEDNLLADATWETVPSADQAAFAERLLAQHSPMEIAAACLRLYRAQKCAPEELMAPDAKAPARDRKPFGPSTWYALSVGHDDRAEARWLLPLLCRAGNIEKDGIGAIRVQKTETFVELSQAYVAGFNTALGANGELEEGVKARQLDAPPQLAPAGRGGPPKGPRSFDDGDRPRKPRTGPKPGYSGSRDAGAGAKPAREKRAPWQPDTAASEQGYDKAPAGGDPAGKGKFGKPNAGKGKPEGKHSGKPAGKPAGKPKAKYSAKPKGKPAGARKPYRGSDK